MGFKEDVATHLVATVSASQEAVVGAVLKTIGGLGDSTVLMQGFDDATNTLVVGFKERGGKTLAKAWLHGGLGGPIQAAQRLQQVSPQVSVKIVNAGDGKVAVATKIEHYSYTRVSRNPRLLATSLAMRTAGTGNHESGSRVANCRCLRDRHDLADLGTRDKASCPCR